MSRSRLGLLAVVPAVVTAAFSSNGLFSRMHDFHCGFDNFGLATTFAYATPSQHPRGWASASSACWGSLVD